MEEALVEAIKNLQAATIDLAAKVYWLYNACDFIDREEAMDLIDGFNHHYQLVEELDVIDPEAFENLTPDMFNDPEPPTDG